MFLFLTLFKFFDPESLIGRWLEKLGYLKESIQDKWLFLTNYDAYLKKQQNQEIIKKNLSTFVDNPHIEWDRLKEINDTKIQWFCRYRDLALTKTELSEKTKIYQSMENLIEKVAEKPKLMTVLKETAPKFAVFINEIVTVNYNKELKRINWQDPIYQQEFEKLRTVDDSTVQHILKFYDLFGEKIDHKKIASINKSISDLVIKISKKPSALETVQRIAPGLAKAFKQFIKNCNKDKNHGIEKEF